jgi:HAE1 family hydrophobic/amphiphilic exporter-1
MFLARLSINRPILMSMFIFILLLFGAIAYFALPLNLMPVAEFPYVTVQTIYPGAGSQEIEMQVTKRIEDAVSTVSQIQFVQSYSMDNVSYVILAFDLGKDANVASQEVKDKVDAIIQELPRDAERPSVQKLDITAHPIIDLVFSGNLNGRELYEIADKTLRDRFSQIEGVAKVNIIGGQKREIHVHLESRVVYQNSISLAQFSQILAAHNIDMPGGNFTQRDQDYTVRLSGEFSGIEAIKEVEIPTQFGIKKLHQLADVKDSGNIVRERSLYFNNLEKYRNENVIRLSIVKTPEGNPVTISESVHKILPGIRSEIPANTDLFIINDNSDFIKETVRDTMNNVLLGILFTGLVLLFFLHDIRSTLIVAIAMPTSIIATFWVLQFAGFSINILSLMGLSTSVGVLVANSVVVLENIFRHMRMGHNRRMASNVGTAEVTVAVVASTLTNIAVFLPIAMMSTLIGTFLREFALTVTFATIFSLIISFTLTPMLASLILPENKKKNVIGEKIESVFTAMENGYHAVLSGLFRSKTISFIAFFLSIVLFIMSFSIAKQLGFELFPTIDEGNIAIKYNLPEGYNLEQTNAMYERIEGMIETYPEVQHIVTNLGTQGDIDKGTNLGLMNVKLTEKKNREKSTQQVANEFIEKFATIPNITFKVLVTSSMGGGEGGAIQFNLMGQESAKLNEIAEAFLERAKTVPGLINFDSSLRIGKPEIILLPMREKLARTGITPYDLALTLRASVEGMTATKYREMGNEYDVIISIQDEDVNTIDKIKNIPVITPYGNYRVSQLADVQYGSGSTKIIHYDKFVSVEFTGDVGEGAVQGNVINELSKLQQEFNLPEGYHFKWTGMSEMMEENNREMGKAFMLAIILTYMLLAAILESFTKPFIILITIPLALIGVFIALYVTGISFNMISMLAVIMLIGIVVNAAILIMDYTQLLREQGKDTKSALLEACPTKLKPILMSSVAIILGMLPMALGIGSAGAEMRKALGIVSIGGITVSTIFTLFIIPALYFVFTKANIKKLEKM